MNKIALPAGRIRSLLRIVVTNDAQRKSVIFVCFNVIMGLVSAFMTAVNIFTDKRLLMYVTLIFSIACFLNVLMFRLNGIWRKITIPLFLLEAISLCGFFCVSGTPEGFSALWTCFIPSFMLTLLGQKEGSLYSGLVFLMIAFLFWTPYGRSVLQYQYTDSFMLRFPMIYIAFYLVGLLLEIVRAETQKQLQDAEHRYQHLYKHDALTGIYNRHGFNELLDHMFAAEEDHPLTLMILDLDHFKNINDTYGHDIGDVVLKSIAVTLSRLGRENSIICRWGGEEFTVLVSECPCPEEYAEKIRHEIEITPISNGSTDIRITVSIGVCTVNSKKNISGACLIRCADQNLYRAKDTGRNKVVATRL